MAVLGLKDEAPASADRAELERYYADLGRRCEEVLASRTAAEWKPLFDARGVPGAAVRFSTELFDDAQALANGFFHDLPHPVLGSVRVLAPPVRIDGWLVTGEPIGETQRGLRSLGKVRVLVVGELGDQVLRRAPAHGRGGTREASVNAAIVPGQLHAHELEQLRLDARAAAIDVADEAPGGVEQAGAARHREEEIVIFVRIAVPAI